MLRKISLLILPALFAFSVHAAEITGPQTAANNDALIKQYMDTKNPEYLRAMLKTYAAADEDMLRDARRYAFLVPLTRNPEDPKNPRPSAGRTSAMALCSKYGCTPTPESSKQFMQVLTASSGIWALDSLSLQDPAIGKIVRDFLAANPRMKTVYETEAVQFSNYKVLLMTASLQPEKVEPLLVTYESFKPLDFEVVKQTLGMKPVAAPPPASKP